MDFSASIIGGIQNTFKFVFGKSDPELPPVTQRVVDRFQALLDGHRMSRSLLLKIVPAEWHWSLESLSSPKALLSALGAQQQAWLAQTFGVRDDWIAGDASEIYDWPRGYKQPDRFARHLLDHGWVNDDLTMTILANDYRSGSSNLNQFVIVFSQPVASFRSGEIEILRHVVVDTLLNWSHPPCRWDAMTLARWFHTVANPHSWVPIVPLPYKTIDAIAKCMAFPGPHVPQSIGTYDHFEDWVLASDRSPLSLDHPEREIAMEHFERCQLAAIRPASRS